MERGSPGVLLRQQSVAQQGLAQARALVEELRRQAEAEAEGDEDGQRQHLTEPPPDQSQLS